MKLGDLEFSADDFRKCFPDFAGLAATVAETANERLRERLEKAPFMGSSGGHVWVKHPGRPWDCTHRGRLVCIEELKR